MFKQTPQKRVLFVRSLLPLVLGLLGVLILLYTSFILPAQKASAASDSTINFQARLLNGSGSIVPDGTYNIEFKIYKSLASGASTQGVCVGGVTDDCYWVETRTTTNKVTVKGGYLTVSLGSVNAFTNANTTINWDQDLYLTMNIGGTGAASWDGEMSPRIHLTAVPYALRAGTLASLSGSNTATLSFAGTIGQNTTITLPDPGAGTATVCYQTASACGFASGSGTAFLQGGNTFGAQGVLGTNDGNSLAFRTNSGNRLILDTSGNLQFQQASTINNLVAATGTQLTIKGGDANNGTNAGGNLLLQGGAGNSTGLPGSVIVKANTNNSTTAFQVQNASGDEILTVDSTGSLLALGDPGASGIDGKLVFYDAAGAHTVTLAAPTSDPGSSYTLNLPSSGPSTSQCLKTDASVATTLTFAACGGGSGVTTVGTIDTNGASTDGATISGTSIYMQSASATRPGLVNNTTQTLSGDKSLTGNTSIGTVGSATAASTAHIGDTSDATNAQVVTIGSAAANTGNITTLQGGSNTTGAIALTPNVAGGIMIGAGAGTGTITLGQSTATNTISIGSAVVGASNTQTINIGNGAGAGTAINVNILSGVGTAGTGTLSLGNNTRVTQIDVGNVAAAAARTLNFGSGANTVGIDTLNIGTGATTVAGGKTIHIGDGTPTGSGTNLITIGSIAALANTTTIQGGNGAGAVSLQAATSGTISLGTTNVNTVTVGSTANTGTLTFGQSTAGENINIGNGNVASGNTNNINIGATATSTGKDVVTIGSLVAASTLALQGGTGAAALTAQVGASGTISIGTTNQTSTLNLGNTSASSQTLINGGTGGTAISIQQGASGTILMGTTNAGTINIGAIGSTANADTVHIADSTGATQTITIGGSATNNGSAAGTTVKLQGGQTSETLANTGDTIQTFTNSTTAFQVQNASNQNLLKLDNTTGNNIIVNSGFTSGSTYWSSKGTSTIFQELNNTVYNTGTSGTGGVSTSTVTGSGTTWTSSLVGDTIVFSNDGLQALITAVGSNTSLTVSSSITESSGQAYYIISAPAFDSSASLKAVATATSSGMQTSTFNTTILPTTQYQLTFWAKCSVGMSTLTYGRQDVNGTNINATTTDTCNTYWTQYTTHFTTGGTITSPNIYINTGATAADVIWVDDVSLVQTTSSGATSYTAGSTGALQLQNSSGASLLNADTANMRLGINTTFSTMIAPTGLTGVACSSSCPTGTLSNGNVYKYEVTAIDSLGGETTVSANEPTVTVTATQVVTLTWNALSGASGYKIYRTGSGGASGTETYLTTTTGAESSTTQLSFNDTGAFTPNSTNPPATNNAYTSNNTSNTYGQLSIGGNGTPTGQLYVSGTVPTTYISSFVPNGLAPTAIKIQGHYGYTISHNNDNFQVIDYSNPAAPVSISVIGTLSHPAYLTVQGNYAYLADDTNNKLEIINISNPFAPFSISNISTGTSPQYVYVQGRYAYVVNNGGTNALTIFDVSNPAAPVQVGTITDASGNPAEVYVQGHYAYVSNNNGGGGINIYDVSNPYAPFLTGTNFISNTWGINVQGRYAYATFNSANGSLQIMDVSNPANPITVGVLSLNTPRALTVQGRYAYIQTSNAIQVVDISNPASPFSVGTISTGGNPPVDISVQGRYLYGAIQSSSLINAYDIGGAYSQSLQAGSADVATLSVDTNANVFGDAAIVGGVTVGTSLQVAGSGTLGGLTINGLATVGAPVVSNVGTTGSAHYTYAVTAFNASGNAPTSTGTQTLTGNANLNTTTIYNHITWTAVTGALGYYVYRTATTGTTPSTIGLIGVVYTGSTLQFDDKNVAGDTTTAPTANNAGTFVAKGTALFGDASNSTTAFQIQNASSASLFTADTTNMQLTVANNGALDSFQTDATATNASVDRPGIAYANGYTYLVGGFNSSGLAVNNVQIGTVKANGTMTWAASANTLPGKRAKPGTVVANGYLYAIGGIDDTGTEQGTVYYAKINNDGTIGTWNTGTALASTREGAGAVFINGYIYLIGGSVANSIDGTTLYGKVNGDGTVTTWNSGTVLGTHVWDHASVAANGYIYAIGGRTTTGTGTEQTLTQYATINQNTGAIGAWSTTTAYSATAYTSLSASIANGYVYVLGGKNISTPTRAISYGALNTDGTISSFTTTATALPVARSSGASFTANGYVYYLVGTSTGADAGVTNTSYYASTSGRVQLSGSLDLVSGSGGTLANPGSGGSLTAGNTSVVGTLQVVDNTSLLGGLSVNGPVTVGNSTNSTSALQVQNASGNQVFAVDTTNGQAVLGKASTISGAAVFNTTSGASTVTLGVGATSSSYSVLLPTAGGSANQCLQLGGSGGSQLQWGTCGSAATGLSKNAADTSSASVSAASLLYTFTNSNTATAGGVLKLDNGTNTASNLQVVGSGNMGATNAYIFAKNSNASPSGNLLELQNNVASGTDLFTVSATGSATHTTSTNSTTGFVVQNSTPSAVLTVDTSTSPNRVIIGAGATGDTTGELLLLDSKTTAGDPTGTNGGIYYNSNAATFRCFENSTWKNCLGSPSNASTADQSPAASATTELTGSTITIPTGGVRAGSIFKWRITMTKTGAGTVANTFDIRFGTNGTTADTSRCSFAMGTETAAADTAVVDLTVTVRSVSATGTIACNYSMVHNLSNTGFDNTLSAKTTNVTSGTFDDTVASSIMGVSITTGASYAITVQQVQTTTTNL